MNRTHVQIIRVLEIIIKYFPFERAMSDLITIRRGIC